MTSESKQPRTGDADPTTPCSMLRSFGTWDRWYRHVMACARCLPSGGYNTDCTEGPALRRKWRASEARAERRAAKRRLLGPSVERRNDGGG